jgi:putative flippase GtrA
MPAPPATEPSIRGRVERFSDSLVPGPLRHRREQVQYLVVGGWNTFFGYAAWAVLQYLFGDVVDYRLIIIASYPIAIANAYVTHRYIVFRSHGPILREIPRFSFVYVLTLLANLLLLPVLLEVIPLSIYLVQGIFLVGVVITSYIGHRYFSFGYRGQHPDAGPSSAAEAPTGSSDPRTER